MQAVSKGFIYYDLSTGEIVKAITIPFIVNMIDAAVQGFGVVSGVCHDISNHIIDVNTMEIVEKDLNPAEIDKISILANGEDVATISGLSPNSFATVGGVRYQVNDGTLEITIDAPGYYVIRVEDRIHLPKEFGVNAS